VKLPSLYEAMIIAGIRSIIKVDGPDADGKYKGRLEGHSKVKGTLAGRTLAESQYVFNTRKEAIKSTSALRKWCKARMGLKVDKGKGSKAPAVSHVKDK